MGVRTWVWNAGVQPGRCHPSQQVKDFMSSYVPPHISSSAVSDCGLMPCLGKSILPLRDLMQVFSYSPFTPKSMLLKGLTVAC